MRNFGFRLREYTADQLADIIAKYGPTGTLQANQIPTLASV